MDLVLTFCVDGGGSKSRARLVDSAGRVLAEAEEGPCNPSTDLDRAVRSTLSLWRRCASLAKIAPDKSDEITLAIGAAGLYVASSRAKFLAALPRFGRTVTMSDGYAALIGAGGGKPCGLMIIGTGIAGHRLWPDGFSIQRDAWGWIAGDRGSGAWLGRKALRHTLSVIDGIHPRDGLSERILAALGGRAGLAEGMVGMGPDRLAALAPHVIAAAAAGVGRAIHIRDRAVHHLANLAGVLDIGPADTLYAFGGLSAALAPELAKRIDHPVTLPEADAMTGSYLVAMGLAPAERIKDEPAVEMVR